MTERDITPANFTNGETSKQLMDARTSINARQAALFKTGGDYTCPTTENSTQGAIMNKVCQTNVLQNNINKGVQVAGKTKRKRKSKKKSKRKMKKKSKRRK